MIAPIILTCLWVAGIEYLHHKEFGHFVTYGIHVDALNRDADIGIPGQTKMYWPRLSNYTLWPVKLAACDYVTDALAHGTQYPYAVQRWNASSSNWDTIVEINGENYCDAYPLGLIKTDLVSKRLWPGMSVDVMDGEATGARDSFQKNDKARFVIFTTSSKQYAWKTAIPSAAFVIQDQVMRRDGPNRVRH